MKAFIKHLKIQISMDFRNRGTLLTYYIIPLVFYIVMGAVFSSIQPESKYTLTPSMSIFAVTMGAVLGIPPTLIKMRESGTLRAYRVSSVPGWSALLTISLSAFINLILVSTIILISAPLIFGAAAPANILVFYLVLFLFTFASISLGILIGVTSKTQALATILSQVVFLPSLLLGGLMFPASMLPQPMQWAGMAFPATHAMQAFSNWAFGMDSSGHSPLPIFIMLGILIITASLGLLQFRRISKDV